MSVSEDVEKPMFQVYSPAAGDVILIVSTLALLELTYISMCFYFMYFVCAVIQVYSAFMPFVAYGSIAMQG